jgi:hypothetical protein
LKALHMIMGRMTDIAMMVTMSIITATVRSITNIITTISIITTATTLR